MACTAALEGNFVYLAPFSTRGFKFDDGEMADSFFQVEKFIGSESLTLWSLETWAKVYQNWDHQ